MEGIVTGLRGFNLLELCRLHANPGLSGLDARKLALQLMELL